MKSNAFGINHFVIKVHILFDNIIFLCDIPQNYPLQKFKEAIGYHGYQYANWFTFDLLLI